MTSDYKGPPGIDSALGDSFPSHFLNMDMERLSSCLKPGIVLDPIKHDIAPIFHQEKCEMEPGGSLISRKDDSDGSIVHTLDMDSKAIILGFERSLPDTEGNPADKHDPAGGGRGRRHKRRSFGPNFVQIDSREEFAKKLVKRKPKDTIATARSFFAYDWDSASNRRLDPGRVHPQLSLEDRGQLHSRGVLALHIDTILSDDDICRLAEPCQCIREEQGTTRAVQRRGAVRPRAGMRCIFLSSPLRPEASGTFRLRNRGCQVLLKHRADDRDARVGTVRNNTPKHSGAADRCRQTGRRL